MADPRDVAEHEHLSLGAAKTLPSVVHVAWRHKMLMLIGVAVAVVGGTVYYSQAKPLYQSNAKILVIQKTPAIALPGSGESRGTYADDALGAHIVLIQSPIIVGKAIKLLSLNDKLHSLKSFEGQDPTSAIIDQLRVTREKEASSVLTLTYRCAVSEDCPIVLDAIMESYLEFLRSKYKNVSDETVSTIKELVDDLSIKLDEKEKAFKTLTIKNVGLLKGGTSFYKEQLVRLQAEGYKLKVRKEMIEGQIERLNKAMVEGRSRQEQMVLVNASLQKLAGEANKPSVKDEVWELELKLDELLQSWGPEALPVKEVKHKIEMVMNHHTLFGKDPINEKDPVKAHLNYLQLELQEAQADGDFNAKLLASMQKAAQEDSNNELEADNLQEAIKRGRETYSNTLRRLSEMDMVKNLGGYDANPIYLPGNGWQVAPRTNIIFGVAGFLGLLLGLGLAYAAELTDHSFRTPEEIRHQLGLPVVGHVPFFCEVNVPDATSADAAAVAPMLAAFHRPKSREAEAYRGVRTSLFFSARKGGYKVIQVTSPDKGDGKSTLAANLAISIAQSGKRVILIDADLRRPNVHRLFGVLADQGLASVISDEAKLADVIKQTIVPGLSLIPCGPLPPNPAELLSSPRLKEILDELRERFDFLIVDTPPLLAITDPCVVVPHVDGVFLNIRVRKNARPHALRAKEILTTLGANVLGVVVNEADRSAGMSYGYGGYRYNYGYSYGGEKGNESYYSNAQDEDGEGTNGYASATRQNGHEPAPDQPRPRPRKERKKSLLSRLLDRL